MKTMFFVISLMVMVFLNTKSYAQETEGLTTFQMLTINFSSVEDIFDGYTIYNSETESFWSMKEGWWEELGKVCSFKGLFFLATPFDTALIEIGPGKRNAYLNFPNVISQYVMSHIETSGDIEVTGKLFEFSLNEAPLELKDTGLEVKILLTEIGQILDVKNNRGETVRIKDFALILETSPVNSLR